MRAIVGPVHDKAIIGDAEIVQRLKNSPDVLVMIDHRVVVRTLETSGLSKTLRLGVGPQVHVSEVDPDKERLVGVLLPLDEVHRAIRDVIVNRNHARFGQGTSVLTDLLADFPEERIDSGVVVVGSLAVHTSTRAVL